ncbi:MAG: twin-arginine translocation signal domain-containing protein [Burkholderiaceae bacterium]|nr:twin-arginine translocation signal domain-containing protein [Burkholderiaceae bacterium]
MNAPVPNLSRRQFIVGSSAVSAGLAIGLEFPAVIGSAQASTAQAAMPPEIGVWVMIQPNDTVIIRVVRSEMGQGTRTGLAQLVAEELECDWSKITTESPTPGQNLKRKRAWGDYSTGGSRGIRESHEYVRKGGATARMMLIHSSGDFSITDGSTASLMGNDAIGCQAFCSRNTPLICCCLSTTQKTNMLTNMPLSRQSATLAKLASWAWSEKPANATHVPKPTKAA